MKEDQDLVDREEISQAVRACVAESLALDPDKISMDSRLVEQLGADSLDFLDFIFALEKKFGIKLSREGLEQLLRADFLENDLTDEDYLSSEAVERLSEWMPELRAAPERDKVTPRQLYSYITLESLAILVERRLRDLDPAEAEVDGDGR